MQRRSFTPTNIPKNLRDVYIHAQVSKICKKVSWKRVKFNYLHGYHIILIKTLTNIENARK